MLGSVDRAQRHIFPPTLDELLPADHLARFVVQVVEELDLEDFEKEFSDSRGRLGYPPSMLISLWLYGYATKVNSSRKLEEATRMSLPFMFIAGGCSPDHTTLSTFRKRHGEEFKRLAAQAIQVLVGSGVITLSSLAVDGSKVRACASRENLITAKTARKRIDAYQSIIADLTEATDQADEQEASEAAAVSKIDPASQEKIRKLLSEVEQLERLATQLEEKDEAVRAEAKAKVEAYEKSQEENGKAPKGRPPKAPSDEPEKPAKGHLFDEDATFMKTREGILPGYNGQATVDVETQLIVASSMTTEANDKHQIEPLLKEIESLSEAGAEVDENDENDETAEVAEVAEAAEDDENDEQLKLLADAGYFSAENVEACEKAGVEPYIATGRGEKAETPKGKDSPAVSRMVERMNDADGKALYGKRKSTVETTFGCIKEAMGFRQLKMRGLEGAEIEWQLACLAWNFKRLFSLHGTSLFA